MSEKQPKRCADCRAEWPKSYMVKPEVWALAVPDYAEWKRRWSYAPIPACFIDICIACLSKRLGRPLRRADLNGAPINDWIGKQPSP